MPVPETGHEDDNQYCDDNPNSFHIRVLAMPHHSERKPLLTQWRFDASKFNPTVAASRQSAANFEKW
jgi:hypothetical protein